MVLNATFNNISVITWLSLLLVEETGENHKPVTSHRQTLSNNVVSSTPRHDRYSKSNHWWRQALIVVNPTTIYYHDGPFVNAQLVFISTAISEKAFLTFSHRFPCQNKHSDDHYLSFQIDINYSVIIHVQHGCH